jgi:hypothetical protein
LAGQIPPYSYPCLNFATIVLCEFLLFVALPTRGFQPAEFQFRFGGPFCFSTAWQYPSGLNFPNFARKLTRVPDQKLALQPKAFPSWQK